MTEVVCSEGLPKDGDMFYLFRVEDDGAISETCHVYFEHRTWKQLFQGDERDGAPFDQCWTNWRRTSDGAWTLGGRWSEGCAPFVIDSNQGRIVKTWSEAVRLSITVAARALHAANTKRDEAERAFNAAMKRPTTWAPTFDRVGAS